jgi:hypothetical protein
MSKKHKELLWLLMLWDLRGRMNDKELIELFKILCHYPLYFNIPEPIQDGYNFIYTIEIKDKFLDDLNIEGTQCLKKH